MSYTLNLDLGGLPVWARTVVEDGAKEHDVTVKLWPTGQCEVRGPDEQTTRLACTAGLQRIGKTIDDVVIDLFA